MAAKDGNRNQNISMKESPGEQMDVRACTKRVSSESKSQTTDICVSDNVEPYETLHTSTTGVPELLGISTDSLPDLSEDTEFEVNLLQCGFSPIDQSPVKDKQCTLFENTSRAHHGSSKGNKTERSFEMLSCWKSHAEATSNMPFYNAELNNGASTSKTYSGSSEIVEQTQKQKLSKSLSLLHSASGDLQIPSLGVGAPLSKQKNEENATPVQTSHVGDRTSTLKGLKEDERNAFRMLSAIFSKAPSKKEKMPDKEKPLAIIFPDSSLQKRKWPDKSFEHQDSVKKSTSPSSKRRREDMEAEDVLHVLPSVATVGSKTATNLDKDQSSLSSSCTNLKDNSQMDDAVILQTKTPEKGKPGVESLPMDKGKSLLQPRVVPLRKKGGLANSNYFHSFQKAFSSVASSKILTPKRKGERSNKIPQALATEVSIQQPVLTQSVEKETPEAIGTDLKQAGGKVLEHAELITLKLQAEKEAVPNKDAEEIHPLHTVPSDEIHNAVESGSTPTSPSPKRQRGRSPKHTKMMETKGKSEIATREISETIIISTVKSVQKRLSNTSEDTSKLRDNQGQLIQTKPKSLEEFDAMSDSDQSDTKQSDNKGLVGSVGVETQILAAENDKLMLAAELIQDPLVSDTSVVLPSEMNIMSPTVKPPDSKQDVMPSEASSKKKGILPKTSNEAVTSESVKKDMQKKEQDVGSNMNSDKSDTSKIDINTDVGCTLLQEKNNTSHVSGKDGDVPNASSNTLYVNEGRRASKRKLVEEKKDEKSNDSISQTTREDVLSVCADDTELSVLEKDPMPEEIQIIGPLGSEKDNNICPVTSDASTTSSQPCPEKSKSHHVTTPVSELAKRQERSPPKKKPRENIWSLLEGNFGVTFDGGAEMKAIVNLPTDSGQSASTVTGDKNLGIQTTDLAAFGLIQGRNTSLTAENDVMPLIMESNKNTENQSATEQISKVSASNDIIPNENNKLESGVKQLNEDNHDIVNLPTSVTDASIKISGSLAVTSSETPSTESALSEKMEEQNKMLTEADKHENIPSINTTERSRTTSQSAIEQSVQLPVHLSSSISSKINLGKPHKKDPKEPHKMELVEPHKKDIEAHKKALGEPRNKDPGEPHKKDAGEPHKKVHVEPHKKDLGEHHKKDQVEPHKKHQAEPQKKDLREPHKKDPGEPHKKDAGEPHKKDLVTPHKKDLRQPHKKHQAEPHKKDPREPQKKDLGEPHKKGTGTGEPQKKDLGKHHKEDLGEPHKKDAGEPQKKGLGTPHKKDPAEPYKKHQAEPHKKDPREPQKKDPGKPHKKEAGEPHKKDLGTPPKEDLRHAHKKDPAEPHKNHQAEPHKKDPKKPEKKDAGEPQKKDLGTPHKKDPAEPHKKHQTEPHKKDPWEPQKKDPGEPQKKDLGMPHKKDTAEPRKKLQAEPHKKYPREPKKTDPGEPQKKDLGSPHKKDLRQSHKKDPAEPHKKHQAEPNKKDPREPQKTDPGEPHKKDAGEPQKKDLGSPHKKDLRQPHKKDPAEPHKKHQAEPNKKDPRKPQKKDLGTPKKRDRREPPDKDPGKAHKKDLRQPNKKDLGDNVIENKLQITNVKERSQSDIKSTKEVREKIPAHLQGALHMADKKEEDTVVVSCIGANTGDTGEAEMNTNFSEVQMVSSLDEGQVSVETLPHGIPKQSDTIHSTQKKVGISSTLKTREAANTKKEVKKPQKNTITEAAEIGTITNQNTSGKEKDTKIRSVQDTVTGIPIGVQSDQTTPPKVQNEKSKLSSETPKSKNLSPRRAKSSGTTRHSGSDLSVEIKGGKDRSKLEKLEVGVKETKDDDVKVNLPPDVMKTSQPPRSLTLSSPVVATELQAGSSSLSEVLEEYPKEVRDGDDVPTRRTRSSRTIRGTDEGSKTEPKEKSVGEETCKDVEEKSNISHKTTLAKNVPEVAQTSLEGQLMSIVAPANEQTVEASLSKTPRDQTTVPSDTWLDDDLTPVKTNRSRMTRRSVVEHRSQQKERRSSSRKREELLLVEKSKKGKTGKTKLLNEDPEQIVQTADDDSKGSKVTFISKNTEASWRGQQTTVAMLEEAFTDISKVSVTAKLPAQVSVPTEHYDNVDLTSEGTKDTNFTKHVDTDYSVQRKSRRISSQKGKETSELDGQKPNLKEKLGSEEKGTRQKVREEHLPIGVIETPKEKNDKASEAHTGQSPETLKSKTKISAESYLNSDLPSVSCESFSASKLSITEVSSRPTRVKRLASRHSESRSDAEEVTKVVEELSNTKEKSTLNKGTRRTRQTSEADVVVSSATLFRSQSPKKFVSDSGADSLTIVGSLNTNITILSDSKHEISLSADLSGNTLTKRGREKPPSKPCDEPSEDKETVKTDEKIEPPMDKEKSRKKADFGLGSSPLITLDTMAKETSLAECESTPTQLCDSEDTSALLVSSASSSPPRKKRGRPPKQKKKENPEANAQDTPETTNLVAVDVPQKVSADKPTDFPRNASQGVGVKTPEKTTRINSNGEPVSCAPDKDAKQDAKAAVETPIQRKGGARYQSGKDRVNSKDEGSCSVAAATSPPDIQPQKTDRRRTARHLSGTSEEAQSIVNTSLVVQTVVESTSDTPQKIVMSTPVRDNSPVQRSRRQGMNQPSREERNMEETNRGEEESHISSVENKSTPDTQKRGRGRPPKRKSKLLASEEGQSSSGVSLSPKTSIEFSKPVDKAREMQGSTTDASENMEMLTPERDNSPVRRNTRQGLSKEDTNKEEESRIGEESQTSSVEDKSTPDLQAGKRGRGRPPKRKTKPLASGEGQNIEDVSASLNTSVGYSQPAALAVDKAREMQQSTTDTFQNMDMLILDKDSSPVRRNRRQSLSKEERNKEETNRIEEETQTLSVEDKSTPDLQARKRGRGRPPKRKSESLASGEGQSGEDQNTEDVSQDLVCTAGKTTGSHTHKDKVDDDLRTPVDSVNDCAPVQIIKQGMGPPVIEDDMVEAASNLEKVSSSEVLDDLMSPGKQPQKRGRGRPPKRQSCSLRNKEVQSILDVSSPISTSNKSEQPGPLLAENTNESHFPSSDVSQNLDGMASEKDTVDKSMSVILTDTPWKTILIDVLEDNSAVQTKVPDSGRTDDNMEEERSVCVVAEAHSTDKQSHSPALSPSEKPVQQTEMLVEKTGAISDYIVVPNLGNAKIQEEPKKECMPAAVLPKKTFMLSYEEYLRSLCVDSDNKVSSPCEAGPPRTSSLQTARRGSSIPNRSQRDTRTICPRTSDASFRSSDISVVMMPPDYDLKDCSVLLDREECKKLLALEEQKKSVVKKQSLVSVDTTPQLSDGEVDYTNNGSEDQRSDDQRMETGDSKKKEGDTGDSNKNTSCKESLTTGLREFGIHKEVCSEQSKRTSTESAAKVSTIQLAEESSYTSMDTQKFIVHVFDIGPKTYFRCTACPGLKVFLRRYDIARHLLIHYKTENGFKCRWCKRIFGKMKEFGSHIRQVHEWTTYEEMDTMVTEEEIQPDSTLVAAIQEREGPLSDSDTTEVSQLPSYSNRPKRSIKRRELFDPSGGVGWVEGEEGIQEANDKKTPDDQEKTDELLVKQIIPRTSQKPDCGMSKEIDHVKLVAVSSEEPVSKLATPTDGLETISQTELGSGESACIIGNKKTENKQELVEEVENMSDSDTTQELEAWPKSVSGSEGTPEIHQSLSGVQSDQNSQNAISSSVEKVEQQGQNETVDVLTKEIESENVKRVFRDISLSTESMILDQPSQNDYSKKGVVELDGELEKDNTVNTAVLEEVEARTSNGEQATANEQNAYMGVNIVAGSGISKVLEAEYEDISSEDGADNIPECAEELETTKSLPPVPNTQQTENKCGFCPTVFDSVEELNDHYRNVHAVTKMENLQAFLAARNPSLEDLMTIRPYQCQECFRSFKRHDDLRKHSLIHRRVTKGYECAYCTVAFRSTFDLDKHIRKHHKEREDAELAEVLKPYKYQVKCELCKVKKVFKVVKHLRNHMTSAHPGEEPYKCKHCMKTFCVPDECKKHELDHANRPFQCDICLRLFSEARTMFRHRELHKGSSLSTDCVICEKKFTSLEQCKHHMKEHKKDQCVNMCPHCERTFISRSNMELHVRVVHTGERPYKCMHCEATFHGKRHLNRHVVKHTGEKPHNCIYCPAGFVEKNDLKRHIKANHCDSFGKLLTVPFPRNLDPSLNTVPCPTCGKRFLNHDLLKKHSYVHSSIGLNTCTCEMCGVSFSKKSKLVTHVRRYHTGERPFKCPQCDKQFFTRGAQRNHTLRHTDNRKYFCEKCPKTFFHAHELERHRHVHGANRPYRCNTCSRPFMTQPHLSRHMKMHESEVTGGSYKCEYCGKFFHTQGYINLHLRRVHAHEKPFKCDTCSMEFSSNGMLKKHKARHANEINYKCQFCEKKFLDKNEVKQHVKQAHPMVRAYQCVQCNQTYKKKQELDEHMLMHSDERTFLCSHCPMSFSQSSSLQAHVQSMHNGPKYKCDLCSKVYCNQKNYMKHSKTHLPENNMNCPICNKMILKGKVFQNHILKHQKAGETTTFEKDGTLYIVKPAPDTKITSDLDLSQQVFQQVDSVVQGEQSDGIITQELATSFAEEALPHQDADLLINSACQNVPLDNCSSSTHTATSVSDGQVLVQEIAGKQVYLTIPPSESQVVEDFEEQVVYTFTNKDTKEVYTVPDPAQDEVDGQTMPLEEQVNELDTQIVYTDEVPLESAVSLLSETTSLEPESGDADLVYTEVPVPSVETDMAMEAPLDVPVDTEVELQNSTDITESSDNTVLEVGSNEIHGMEVASSDTHGLEVASGDIHGLEVASNDIHGMEVASDDIHGMEVASGDIHGMEVASGDIHGMEVASGDIHGMEVTSSEMHGSLEPTAVEVGETLLSGVPVEVESSQIESTVLTDEAPEMVGVDQHHNQILDSAQTVEDSISQQVTMFLNAHNCTDSASDSVVQYVTDLQQTEGIDFEEGNEDIGNILSTSTTIDGQTQYVITTSEVDPNTGERVCYLLPGPNSDSLEPNGNFVFLEMPEEDATILTEPTDPSEK